MKPRWMLALCFSLAATPAVAQTTIEVPPGFVDYNNFGTLGQTFTAPWDAPVLSEFAFHLSPYYTNPGPGYAYSALAAPVFRLYVMGWDQALFAPVGDALFRSAARSGVTAADSPMGGSLPIEFSMGGLELDPGAMYVAFLTTRDDPQPPPVCVDGRCHQSLNRMAMAYFPPSIPGSPYAGGEMVGSDFWAEAGGEFRGGDRWVPVSSFGGPPDAAFSATFETTATPEPVSMALLGTGLAGLAGAARRRRRRDEQAAAESGS